MKNSVKVLDLFAGAGGFSLGFEQAGADVVAAVEIDQWASQTLRNNHQNTTVYTEDITQVSNQDIRDRFSDYNVDVIIGGPPCQGFSIANRNAGDPKDPRNSLFKDFLRFVDILSPKIVIMENVPNLLKAKMSNGESVINVINNEFIKLGYQVTFDVLNASEFGVPQNRKRLFVIASKNSNHPNFPAPTHRKFDDGSDLLNQDLLPPITTLDAISDLPLIHAREGAEVMEYQFLAENNYQIEMRQGSEKVFNHKAMNHSEKTVERFKHMPVGVKFEDIPENLRPRKRNGNGEVGSFFGQNNRRMKGDEPCHTIAASFYANFIHPVLDRNFTPREGARIQSFPDWYRFYGKPTVVSRKLLSREGRENELFLCQYNQIGNAVPPKLAKLIAKEVIEVLNA